MGIVWIVVLVVVIAMILHGLFTKNKPKNKVETTKNIGIVTDGIDNGNTQSVNVISQILKFIGIIEIIAGFIVGIILADSYIGYQFSWGIFLASVSVGFVTGFITIGFAEIIALLHSINEKEDFH